MPKRTSLSERMEREEKAKGIDAFFESPAPTEKPAIKDTKRREGKSSKKAASKVARKRVESKEVADFVGVFFHILQRQDGLLDRIKVTLKERDGIRVDRSELVREAIDDLAKKYGVPIKLG